MPRTGYESTDRGGGGGAGAFTDPNYAPPPAAPHPGGDPGATDSPEYKAWLEARGGYPTTPTTTPTTQPTTTTAKPWDRDWSAAFTPPAQQPPQQPPADMSWLDMTGKGYGETQFENTDWNGPNAMNEYWEGTQGQFASGPSKTDFLGGYSSAFNPNQQSFSEQMAGRGAGLDPYYDRASKVGLEKLANKFAASGFGSSNTGDAMSDLVSNMYADKANREADFDLRAANQGDTQRFARSREARDWGSERDKANIDREEQRLDYLLGGGRLATDASREGREDKVAGMRASVDAQTLAEGRKGDALDRIFKQTESDRDFYGGGMDEVFDADSANLDKQLEAALGPEYAKYNMTRQQKSDFLELLSSGFKLGDALKKILG
jgi:hypothetical protein